MEKPLSVLLRRRILVADVQASALFRTSIQRPNRTRPSMGDVGSHQLTAHLGYVTLAWQLDR
jgi:hypothetical protein